MKIKKTELFDSAARILEKAGVPREQAEIIADSVVFAHERGKHTHGIGRMSIYLRKISEGLMTADTNCEIISDSGAVARIDAHNGFGQVASHMACETAKEKAKLYGISAVLVGHSNSFGTAGYYARELAAGGLIGMVFGNASPALAPPGGSKPLFGTNPIAVAFPTDNESCPFLLDMATTVAARSKIRAAEKNGEAIPEGWALDENGQPTSDPTAALAGSLLPIGGAKGAGLSMTVDLLAGMLAGAAFAGEPKGLNHKTLPSNVGHAFIAIDPLKFMDREAYINNMKIWISRVHEAGGLFPGERSYEVVRAGGEYVELPDKLAKEMKELLC